MSNITSSDDEENVEHDNDKNEELGKMSRDDESGWVMDTSYIMVQQCMERFQQQQMKLNTLPQPGEESAANYFSKTDHNDGTTGLGVLADIKLPPDAVAAAPALT